MCQCTTVPLYQCTNAQMHQYTRCGAVQTDRCLYFESRFISSVLRIIYLVSITWSTELCTSPLSNKFASKSWQLASVKGRGYSALQLLLASISCEFSLRLPQSRTFTGKLQPVGCFNQAQEASDHTSVKHWRYYLPTSVTRLIALPILLRRWSYVLAS